MDRRLAGGRIFDADAVVIETAIDEISQLPGGAARFQAGFRRVKAAAEHIGLTAVFERAALGVDVHDARGAEPILGRQRPGDELHAADEAGVEFQAESRDAFGQQHVVDAVLQVRMFPPDMQVAVGGRILGHSRRAQDDLVERRVGPERLEQNLRAADVEGGGAETGHDVVAGLVEIGGDHHRIHGDGRLVGGGVAGDCRRRPAAPPRQKGKEQAGKFVRTWQGWVELIGSAPAADRAGRPTKQRRARRPAAEQGSTQQPGGARPGLSR